MVSKSELRPIVYYDENLGGQAVKVMNFGQPVSLH